MVGQLPKATGTALVASARVAFTDAVALGFGRCACIALAMGISAAIVLRHPDRQGD